MARLGRSIPIKPHYGKPAFFPPPTLYTKSLSDTITMSEPSMTRAFTRIFSDTSSISEVFSKAITRLFSTETVTISDDMSTVRGKGIEFNDVISMLDDIRKDITRIFTDNPTISDAFSKAHGFGVSFDDTFSISDTFGVVTAYLRTFSDTINMTDHLNSWLNGLNTLWSKVTRAVGSWTNTAKDTDETWTPEEKP